MSASKATRTLVKSPPELWSEVSTAASLQRHMDQFGEIRIIQLKPETAVAWEGEHARGTITLEASGWGTKVSLTAEPFGAGAHVGTAPEWADQPGPESGDSPGPEPGDRFGPEHGDRLGPEHGDRGEPERGDALKPGWGVVVKPKWGDRREPETGDAGEPERGGLLKPEPGDRREPETGDAGEPERTNKPSREPPPQPVDAEMQERTISPESDGGEAQMRKPRWTRRVGQTFRRWFSPPRQEHADPLTQAPPPEPSQPAHASALVAPEPEQPAASPAPVAPKLEQPAAFPAAVAPEPHRPSGSPAVTPPAPAKQHQAPSAAENASTAALDAALDSLGQAHHRPYSRS